MRWLQRLALALGALFIGGFLLYAHGSTRERSLQPERADAIVVLTGGEERIPTAIGLLRQGAGRRLLISGAHPRASREAIRGQAGEDRPLFDCCIDIGREASDTVGNAEEAREWAEARRFRSLIVVTSSYHLPRALAEFRRAMPDVRLIGHPVLSRALKDAHWWASPTLAQLLAREYLKLIASLARLTWSRTGEPLFARRA